jgi:hypothetical protein
MTDKPLIGYLGSSIDLNRRIRAHYNYSNSENDNRHPKFYNAIRLHERKSFSLLIVEFQIEGDQESLLELEQTYLDMIFNTPE